MSESPESADDFFDDSDESAEVAPAPSTRRGVVVLAVALGAFVFIGIAAAALIAVLVFRVRDRADPNHTVRQKYQARYHSCIADGNGVDSCTLTVFKACEDDAWWRNPAHAGQRDTVCLATIPNSQLSP